MPRNMGVADKAIRLILAVLIAVLYFNGTIAGLLGLILLVVGAVLLLTSFVSICPIYLVLGISTKAKHQI